MGRGNSSGCRSWGGYTVVAGKHFGKGPYRGRRKNLRGRRHPPWGHMGRWGVLAPLTPKRAACPCPPAAPFPGESCQAGVRVWKVGCTSWGAECRAWAARESALPQRSDGVVLLVRCPVLPQALLSSKERVKSSEGAGFLAVGWFFYCFDTLTIIFSLMFPLLSPPVWVATMVRLGCGCNSSSAPSASTYGNPL